MSDQKVKERPEFVEPTHEKGTELAKRGVDLPDLDVRNLHTGQPAYLRYSKEMVALAASTIMPQNYKLPELYFVLEVAATYGLDIFNREIWAVRMSDNQNEPVTILVGVEGLLSVAERHRDYRGNRTSEVYVGDTFQKLSDPRQMPDGTWSSVVHEFDVTADRGELLGAFSEVYREGRPTEFFWAPIVEYKRTGSRTPWNKQETAMIRKCALANALRRAFRLSGLYIPEELEANQTRARNGALTSAGEPVGDEFDFGPDPYTALQLRELFEALDALKPEAYLPGKKRLLLANIQDEQGYTDLVAQLQREIIDAGGTVPEPPDIAEAVPGVVVEEPIGDDAISFGAPDEEIEDGEVVPCAHPAEDVEESEEGKFCRRCGEVLDPSNGGGQETLNV